MGSGQYHYSLPVHLYRQLEGRMSNTWLKRPGTCSQTTSSVGTSSADVNIRYFIYVRNNEVGCGCLHRRRVGNEKQQIILEWPNQNGQWSVVENL